MTTKRTNWAEVFKVENDARHFLTEKRLNRLMAKEKAMLEAKEKDSKKK